MIGEVFNQLKAEINQNRLLHLLIKHFSTNLIINENAVSYCALRLETKINKKVPENMTYYSRNHEDIEGMYAYIKANLFGNNLAVLIIENNVGLGMW